MSDELLKKIRDLEDQIVALERKDRENSRDLRKLWALEAGGVDNWEWYDEALEEYRNELEKEDEE